MKLLNYKEKKVMTFLFVLVLHVKHFCYELSSRQCVLNYTQFM